jgi:hypothetical protein
VIKEHLLGSVDVADAESFRRVTDRIGLSLGAKPGDSACG